VYNETGWKVVAHGKFWSADTVYAKQNGGKWSFIIEDDMALPLETAFWEELFRSPTEQWGLATYEQDWLPSQFGMNATLRSATLGRQWLKQMADAALNANITVEYCSAWPRFILQSVEFQAVTQSRASDDYHPGNDQWRVGYTSMLLDALALTPAKDNFRSKAPGDKAGGGLQGTVHLEEGASHLRRGQCELYVQEYGDEIIGQVIDGGAKSSSICETARLCGSDITCALCSWVVKALTPIVRFIIKKEDGVREKLLLKAVELVCLPLPEQDDEIEPYSRLQAVVSTLTGGPVAPSDGIGDLDRELLAKSCRKDGKLLRPDVPARIVDSALRSTVFAAEAAGDVWAAQSMIMKKEGRNDDDIVVHAQVLSAESIAHTVTIDDILFLQGEQQQQQQASVGDGEGNGWQFVGFEANSTHNLSIVDAQNPLRVPSSDKSSFQLWNLSPILPNGWALLGEQEKWVAVSSVRFDQLSELDDGDDHDDDDGISVLVNGVEGEEVQVSAALLVAAEITACDDKGGNDGQPSVQAKKVLSPSLRLFSAVCQFNHTGAMEVRFPQATCT